MDWVTQELYTLNLGDKRLDKRGHKVLSELSHRPTDSIPAACSSAAETKATYRFLDNEKVTPQTIQTPHFKATLERMSKHPVVLIAQDTTVLNFSTQFNRQDTGPTTKDNTKGMSLHCSIAITPERICLGTVSSKQWYRTQLQKLTGAQKTKKTIQPL